MSSPPSKRRKITTDDLPTLSNHPQSNDATQPIAEPKPELSELILATVAGDLKRVNELIAAGVPVNARDQNGHCALAMAAICGHNDLVELLLAAKASPDTIHADFATLKTYLPSDGAVLDVLRDLSQKLTTRNADADGEPRTPLHWAARNGNEVLVKALLLARASVDNRTSSFVDQGKPLFEAATQGYTEIVKILLDAKAQVNIKYLPHPSPLRVAVINGHAKVVELLLAVGASQSCENEWGDSILDIAVMRDDEQIVRLLLQKIQVSESEDALLRHALEKAINSRKLDMVKILLDVHLSVHKRFPSFGFYNPLDKAFQMNSIELVKLLIAAKANPNKRNMCGTILGQAAYRGDPAIVRELIKNKPNLEHRDDQKKTPMEHALESGRLEVIKVLAEARADVNICDQSQKGRTPLLLAAERGDAATVKVLIEAGARVNARNTDHVFPLLLVARNGNIDCLRVLIAAKAELNMRDNLRETVLFEAVRNGKLDVVQELLNAGIDVNVRNNTDETALAGASTAEMVNALIAARADVNARDKAGYTPLLNAIVDKSIDVVYSLLKAGANVNIRSYLGMTALLHALRRDSNDNYEDMIQTLLEAKADVNGVDDDGNSVLHLAITSFLDASCVQMLLNAGASVNLRNNRGETALMLSCNGDSNIYHRSPLLLAHRADLNLRDNDGSTALTRSLEVNWTSAIWLLNAGAQWDPLHPSEINAFLSACGKDFTVRVKKTVQETDYGDYDYDDDDEDDEKHLNDDDHDDDHDIVENTDVGFTHQGNNCPGFEERDEDMEDEPFPLELIELLINAKANVNPPSIISEIPLVFAVKRPEVLQLLLNAGAHVNARGFNGETALMAAVKTGAQDSVKLLLQAKADVNIMDFDHVTALKYALKKNDMRTMRLLVDAGAQVETGYSEQVSPLFYALCQGTANMVRILLDGKADVLKLVKYDHNPLIKAARRNKVTTFKHLVAAGLDLSQLEDLSATLLDETRGKDDTALLHVLLEAKAPVDARDFSCPIKTTQLMKAVCSPFDNKTVIEVLLAAGARVDACVDFEGKTALSCDRVINNPGLLKRLLCVLCRQTGYLQPLDKVEDPDDDSWEYEKLSEDARDGDVDVDDPAMPFIPQFMYDHFYEYHLYGEPFFEDEEDFFEDEDENFYEDEDEDEALQNY